MPIMPPPLDIFLVNHTKNPTMQAIGRNVRMMLSSMEDVVSGISWFTSTPASSRRSTS